MDRCCICKSKDTAGFSADKSVLFTDGNGIEKIICPVCREHINRIENTYSSEESNKSILYLRNLCETKKLRDPEAINYLNENVLTLEEHKFTVKKNGVTDILRVTVKVIKWVITVGIAAAGLILGIAVLLALWSTQSSTSVIICAGITIGGGIIAFIFYTFIKMFEEWLYWTDFF